MPLSTNIAAQAKKLYWRYELDNHDNHANQTC